MQKKCAIYSELMQNLFWINAELILNKYRINSQLMQNLFWINAELILN